MKIATALLVLTLSTAVFASECPLDGKNLNTFQTDTDFETQFAIHMPFPPKLLEILEKYFGKFSKANCENSIVITKIINKKTSEYYLAFYTNENRCDGGNSYGVVFKGGDSSQHPVATIEDSYIDCLSQ
jgi:hypothetical protein